MSPAERLDAVLRVCDDVRSAGRSHRARCPECGARTALSIKVGNDGFPVLYCFAQCATNAVRQALIQRGCDPAVFRPPQGARTWSPPLRTETGSDFEIAIARLLREEARRRDLHAEERTMLRLADQIRRHRENAGRWRALASRMAAKLGQHAPGVWDLAEIGVAEDRAADLIEVDLDAALQGRHPTPEETWRRWGPDRAPTRPRKSIA
jgi:hypothetical protein